MAKETFAGRIDVLQKKGTFLYPGTKYEGGGGGLKIPLQSTKYMRLPALAPSDSRNVWASESAAAKQAENYNIKS